MITEYLSQRNAIVGTVAPSQQGTVESLTGAIDLSIARQFTGILKTGVLGSSATVDAWFAGATTAAGGYTKIDASALTQIVKATGDDVVATFTVHTDQINALGLGYKYIKGSVTVGTAASFTDLTVLAGDVRHEPASTNFNLATVKQNVVL